MTVPFLSHPFAQGLRIAIQTAIQGTSLHMIRAIYRKVQTFPLPFKTTKFVGYDLQGNMYFEGPAVRDGLAATRRSIDYHDSRDPYAHYTPDAIPAQWQAWMRHTREDAPSLTELQQDAVRQAQVKAKAAELDAAWEQQRMRLKDAKVLDVATKYQPDSWVPKIK